MPKSKKPRKKGAHGRLQTALRIARKDKYKSVAQMEGVFNTLLDRKRSVKKGASLIAWMNDLSDTETLIAKFATAFFALRRWKTTFEHEDFHSVTRLLMIGGMCHKEMGVQEIDLFRDIQNACFQAIVCVRYRNQGIEIPDGNIDAIHAGLVSAEALVRYAEEHDHNKLLDVIRQNLPEYVHSHPGLKEQRERWILGSRYDLVQRWILNDPPGQMFDDVDDGEELR